MNSSTAHLVALQQLSIASPCTVSWETMAGGEQVRHCAKCNKNVFNLSTMPAPEAAALVAQNSGGELCVRFYRRADGTLMTSDCGPKMRPHKRNVLHALPGLAGMAVLALSVASCTKESVTHETTSQPGATSSGHWVAGGLG